MPLSVIAALLAGAVCAAAGQLLLAVGARGRTELVSFLNLSIIMGLGLYVVGMVFWIYSLSRAPLVQVFPFTALTFVLIYLSGILILAERPTVPGFCGVTLVLAGLYMLSMK
jgi:drug/metabolite transporter (DMT)-like permease